MSAGRNTAGHDLVKGWRWLDGFASVFGAVMTGIWKIPGTRTLKSLLHGTWPLGHPLHPMVTDLTIGGYTAMLAMDGLYLVTREPGLLRAADFLLVGALITSLLSIVSGLTDWNETAGDERRTGMLHGLLMVLASLGFVASLVIRVNGSLDARSTAIAVSTVAWLIMILSSYFGGEMVFGFGTEVNRQAWTEIGDEWQMIDVRAADLQDRKPVLAAGPNGVALFVVRLDGTVHVIGNTCTHAGGPLNEGTWAGADRCEIVCPWHASRFCVTDGSVTAGPATFREPTWVVRETTVGKLEIKASR